MSSVDGNDADNDDYDNDNDDDNDDDDDDDENDVGGEWQVSPRQSLVVSRVAP